MIAKVIKQIENTFWKESYLILYLNDTTLFIASALENQLASYSNLI